MLAGMEDYLRSVTACRSGEKSARDDPRTGRQLARTGDGACSGAARETGEPGQHFHCGFPFRHASAMNSAYRFPCRRINVCERASRGLCASGVEGGAMTRI
jgi:hypothetical protein